MPLVPREMTIEQDGWRRGDDEAALITREWIVTNGLGGYASGSIAGISTRRYHGYLIAALPAPLGRTVMLNHLDETLTGVSGERFRLGGDEYSEREPILPDPTLFERFFLDRGLPVWRYSKDGIVLEKRIMMPHWQNTTYISYRLLSAPAPVELELRPSIHFRPHEQLVSRPLESYRVMQQGSRSEIAAGHDYPPLRIRLFGQHAGITFHEESHPERLYRVELSRGYESAGPLWSPGVYRFRLEPEHEAAIAVSTEPWEAVEAMTPREALATEVERRRQLLSRAAIREITPLEAQLIFAADQFIIRPQTRIADQVRAHAAGDDPRTVIAGYHWFTDWGRDTMISLEGLALATGRFREAGSILRTFGSYVRDGLIPNMFPEGEHEGLYHTADATLWFFHAVHRYVEETGDGETLRVLLPTFISIIDHHVRGTRFGIGVDPADGLLTQGAEGYQLTWMDAKVDDWVVTPRRGKAVEINALFYNALRLLQGWLAAEGDLRAAATHGDLADGVRESFNRRFWFEEGGYLYDVVDGERGDDSALRPNQILAVSLDHPVLDLARWERVVDTVQRELLTPVGLRSLARSHPDYKARYYGDLRARDAAYHQGTVWAWLIGPFVDAWMKVHPEDRVGVRRFLEGFPRHLGDACIGTISEIFDAEEPYTPRGCIAQAWSVAEVFRCWLRTM
ncbi:MAG: amylo-alpha-1,6-glucosidase [Thermoanaerobaculia bacterium]